MRKLAFGLIVVLSVSQGTADAATRHHRRRHHVPVDYCTPEAYRWVIGSERYPAEIMGIFCTVEPNGDAHWTLFER